MKGQIVGPLQFGGMNLTADGQLISKYSVPVSVITMILVTVKAHQQPQFILTLL